MGRGQTMSWAKSKGQMNAEKSQLDKRALRQMLRGYRMMNRIGAVERRAWLERLSVEEARRIFDELHQDADRWRQDGGDLRALERRRIASKVQGRKIFMRAAVRRRRQ